MPTTTSGSTIHQVCWQHRLYLPASSNSETVLYNSNTSPRRLSYQKNLTEFYADLKAERLPQWSFVTPNMTSDGHDSSVTVAGAWSRGFLEPLMSNKYFMERTLILLTFDENRKSYAFP